MRAMLVAWALLAATGCSCGETPCATAECAATFESFRSAYATNTCSRMVSCGFVDATHLRECLTSVSGTGQWLDLSAAVGRGYRAYDPQFGQRCLSELLEQGCDLPVLGWRPSPCWDVAPGAVATGARCLFEGDCAVPGDDCTGFTCERTCRPSGSVYGNGTPCSAASPCGPGLKCDALTATCEGPGQGGRGARCTNDVLRCPLGSWCRGLVIEPDGGVPGSCTSIGEGDPCGAPADCPGAMTCGDAGVCLPTPPCEGECSLQEGAACGAELRCEPPLDCLITANDVRDETCRHRGKQGEPQAQCVLRERDGMSEA